MSESKNRENVDRLIKHFWQHGYLTMYRKYGTYLPAPNPVGTYSVDAVGRYNKRYAIGIILTGDDLQDERTEAKLSFLATRQTKFSNKRVTLFIGVDKDDEVKVKTLIANLAENAKKNIKIVILSEENKARQLAQNQNINLNDLIH